MKQVSKFSAASRLLIVFVTALGLSCSIFESESIKFTTVGTFTEAVGKIGEPFGIAVKGSDVFISDGAKDIIWKISGNGAPAVFSKGLSTPSHIVFDQEGFLFVADSGDHTIRRIAPDGTAEIAAGVSGKKGSQDGPAAEALFNAPVGIAAADGKIYIADTYNDRIRVLADGKVTTIAGGVQGFRDSEVGKEARFDTPTGLGVLGENLLVADTGNRRIRVIGPDGQTGTLAGGGSGSTDGLLGDAGFQMPVAISVDRRGAIYVADGNAFRIIESAFVPIVRTIGVGERGFADGGLKNARFNRPSGLAIVESGDVLVADSDNGLVRVISGSKTVTGLSETDFYGRRTTAAEFRTAGEARWPFKEYKKPREIAGTLGEIRVSGGKSSHKRWFHNGLDIAGGYGEEAVAVRDEKVLRPVAVAEFGTNRENIRFPGLGYIHLRLGRDAEGRLFSGDRFQFRMGKGSKAVGLRIPRGSVFKAGDVLGTLNAMNHVHLIAGPAGDEFNALDALRLPGASDSRLPVLEEIKITNADWTEIKPENGRVHINRGAKVRVIARAYDQMDGNSERRRLGLYKLGYKLLDSQKNSLQGFGSPKWTIVFDKTPAEESVDFVYAEGSRSGATGETVFNYIVSNRVHGKMAEEGLIDLNPGAAKNMFIRVYAADYFGNTTSGDVEIIFGEKS